MFLLASTTYRSADALLNEYLIMRSEICSKKVNGLSYTYNTKMAHLPYGTRRSRRR